MAPNLGVKVGGSLSFRLHRAQVFLQSLDGVFALTEFPLQTPHRFVANGSPLIRLLEGGFLDVEGDSAAVRRYFLGNSSLQHGQSGSRLRIRQLFVAGQ